MYILKIIPISKGLPNDSYSYFYNQEINLGSLVEIKLRNRLILGIVEEATDVKKEKLNIKTEEFILKKIERVIKNNFIDIEIFQNLKDSAILSGNRISEILENYLPNYIYNDLDLLENTALSKTPKNNSKTLYILEDLNDKIKTYQKLIKKTLEKHNSILIFLPTIIDLEYLWDSLKKDLDEKYTVLLHSQLSKKELKNNLAKIKNKHKNNLLILSTPNLFPLLIKDHLNLETIILSKENSNNYQNNLIKKPIDFRNILKNISTILNLKLIITSQIFSIETFKDSELKKIKDKKNKTKYLEIIDMVKNNLNNIESQNKIKKINIKDKPLYSEIFFSQTLIKELEKIKKKKAKAFLFVKRKGLYPETICKDCEAILTCEKCSKPYLLLKDKSGNKYYQCQNCKNIINLNKKINLTCKNCGGWRLTTLGIATEAVAEDLEQNGFKTFILDANHQKNKKEIIETLENWSKELQPSVLIGTELALNFLKPTYDYDLRAIISLDSMSAIPEIDIDIKIFDLILKMLINKNPNNKLIIQTRLKNQPIWSYVKDLKIIDFLNSELKTRQTLNLPPFTKIITWKLVAKEIKIKDKINKILEKIFLEENISNIIPNYKLDKKTNTYYGEMILLNKYWQIKKDKVAIPTTLAKKIYSLLLDFDLNIL